MKKHTPSRLLAATALVSTFALVACGTGGNAGGSSGGESGGDSGGDSQGAQEFSLAWASTDPNVKDRFEVLAEAFIAENPEISVNLSPIPNDQYGQTLTTQLNAGSAPDVFQTAPGVGQGYSLIPFAEEDLIAPLGEAASQAIPAGSESQLQVDGQTYGVALGITFNGSVVNASALDEHGLTFPSNWDDLLSQCTQLADEGKSLFALAGSAPPNTGLMALTISATRVFADDVDWNDKRAAGDVTFSDSAGWRETLEAVVEMNEAGCFQRGAEGSGFDAITNGLLQESSFAAFIPSNSVMDLSQNAAEGTEIKVYPFPAATGGKAFGIAGANYALSLNAKAESNEAAQKFLDYAASAEGQAVFAEASGALPVGSDFSGTPFEPLSELVEAREYRPIPNSQWPNPSVYDALGVGVQGLLTGQKTIEDVLSEMDAAWG